MNFPPDHYELPDRTLRCSLHHLEICGICCVDFTFMRDVIAEDEEEERRAARKARQRASGSNRMPPLVLLPPSAQSITFQPHIPSLTVQILPCVDPTRFTVTKLQPIASPNRHFIPPNPGDHPAALFAPYQHLAHKPRYQRIGNEKQVLLYVDGACINNGRPGAQAGWGLVFSPNVPGANIKSRLELEGGAQTSNRAEVRAAIGALQFRAWYGEGYNSVVIASDSEYLVAGITERVWKWENKGWRTSAGKPVLNQDLWVLLRDEVLCHEAEGVQPQFWLIPREWNIAADALAKEGALGEEVSRGFAKTIGIMC